MENFVGGFKHVLFLPSKLGWKWDPIWLFNIFQVACYHQVEIVWNSWLRWVWLGCWDFLPKKNVFVCVCFACALGKLNPPSPIFLDSIRDLNCVGGKKVLPDTNLCIPARFLQGKLKLPATGKKKKRCCFLVDVSENSGFSPNHPFFWGFSIIFTIHFGGKYPPIFVETSRWLNDVRWLVKWVKTSTILYLYL